MALENRNAHQGRPCAPSGLAAVYTTIRTEKGRLYGIHIADHRPGGGALVCVTVQEPGIPLEYADLACVFSEDEASSMPEHGSQDRSIDLVEGKQPPWGLICNLSAKELDVLRGYLGKHLEHGMIRPSTLPTGTPMFFVPKKDGSLRLCVNYRGLNLITKKIQFPLPLIMEALDQLSGARYFTKLDICDAYHRVRINKGDE
jgi:hypothetical protein